MPDLSVLIPARNEMWLAKTVESVLSAIEADTEIIVVCDGDWPNPPIQDHPRVQLIHHSESIGQRAATNEAARLSKAKYVMKLDAHCTMDKGFDVKLMEDCRPDWTVIPRQYNLHAFDWLCKSCSNRTYQGPTPAKCEKCGSDQIERDIVWKPRWSRKTDAWRFDHDLHFQYWGEYSHRPEAQGEISDTLSCLGACWFMERARYWELEGMDEEHGSWGQMGTELGCKSWLSGGRMVTNKKTWFSHMFRTQGGDFGFPYHLGDAQVQKARQRSAWLWKGGNWPKAKYSLEWLVDRFKPVPGWHDKPQEIKFVRQAAQAQSKGIVYYTDNRLEGTELCAAVRARLIKTGLPIVSVSLKPIDFGKNILVDRQRGIMAMFKQILVGLEALDSDIAFLCEHDVLYHPSHFEFTPPAQDIYYYNENTFKVDSQTGQAVFYYTKQTSGLCADRKLLVEHYRKRIAKCEQNARDLQAKGEPVKNDGFSRHMGFEPGCHSYPRGVDGFRAERWMSEVPNVDVRHGLNLTPSRWSQDQFRNPDACLGWKLADEVPGWGITKGRFSEFLAEVSRV